VVAREAEAVTEEQFMEDIWLRIQNIDGLDANMRIEIFRGEARKGSPSPSEIEKFIEAKLR
jgi:hypothetical protein